MRKLLITVVIITTPIIFLSASIFNSEIEEQQELFKVDGLSVCKAPSLSTKNPTLTTYFTGLFSTDNWPARWTCGDWSSVEGWMYISADLSIFIAYLSIPIMLFWFIRNKDLGKGKSLVLLFAAFILLCGFTHLIDVVLFWEPMYRLSGFTKLITGAVSLTTAIVLGFVIPKALEFKSPEALQAEIDERKIIQSQFEIFVKYCPGAIAMLDSEQRFILANDKYYRAYGIEGVEIIGKTIVDIFPDVKETEWIDRFEKVLLGNKQSKDLDSFELDGNIEYFRWNLEPWYDENNQVGGFIVFTEILTKEIHQQEKLKERDLMMAEVSSVANIGSWDVDVKESKCYWSDTVYRIHEEDNTKEITLDDGINYYHPDHKNIITKAVEEGISKKQPWDLELKIITAKGNEKWTRAIGRAVYENGEVTKLHGLFQDIDKKKRYELEIESSNKGLEEKINERTNALQKANKELEAFSYSVSHDLRAPLRAINGYSEALIEDYNHKIPEDAKKYLLRIAANSKKMGALIDDLLEFSRMNRKKLNFKSIDLNKLIKHLLDELFSDSKKYITLADLPEITGDKSMLKQVFFNLISNAVKYSSKEENPEISISFVEEDTSFVISIQDNGVGFNMDYYNKLFNVFQRLHCEEEFEGTGVGLSICAKIMKAHDGEIWAKAKKGDGASFYLRFKKEIENGVYQ